MKRFQRPIALDQLRGEPIEQFGVGRRNSIEPEIVWSLNQSDSEMALPYPIRDDSGSKRVGIGGDPISDCQPA